MNERLEQEVARYLREECSKDDEPTISEIATHFYNLALEDVRKEVESMEAPIEYNKMEELCI